MILADRIGIEALIAAIQPADGQAFVPQQFLAESMDVDPQVGALNIRRRQTRQPHQFVHDCLLFFAFEIVAFHQRQGVIRHGEIPGFGDGFFQIVLQIGREFMVIPGGGCIGGKEQDKRQVVALIKFGGHEIQDGGYEHNPVQVHAMSLM